MAEEENFYRQNMNQISALMDLMRPMINQVGRLTDRLGHYDVEFIKIGRHFHDLRQDMITLQSAQSQLKAEITSVRSDITSVRSEIAAVRTELATFKSDITTPLDAIFLRLDEIENTGLRNEAALRNLASDMVLQHNAVLNAVQDSHNNKLALEQLDARLSELESQVRQLRAN